MRGSTIEEAPRECYQYPGNRLSDRERDILVLVASGLTSREIGNRLCIATKTVDNHLGAILAKLGASNRVGAVIRGLTAGLIALSPNGEVIIGNPEEPADLVRRLEAVIAKAEAR